MKRLIERLHLNRLRAKLFAAILAVLVLLLILINLFSQPILFRVFAYNTYRTLTAAADRIEFYSPSSVTYYFDIYAVAVNNNLTFEIITADGTIAYTSENGGSAMSDEHFPSSNSHSIHADTVASDSYRTAQHYKNFEIRKRIATNAEYFVYSRETDLGETIYLYATVADVESVVNVAGRVFSAISITLIVAISVVFYLLVSRFTRPLMEMNDITRDMAALNFERKCGDYGTDEIGELGQSINTLSNTLDATLLDLKDKNRQLEKDIEHRHQLDNARKAFISNVSHELKTPIAIISGYAEGVCEGISDDPEVIREYCQIIHDESVKMNALVVELLELSKLESGVQPFTPAPFDLGAKAQAMFAHLALQFEQQAIQAVNAVPAPLLCYAQEDKIEIVLRNYLTNAAAHCAGAQRIVLRCDDCGSTWKITVFNTGAQIAAEDLPEIWDSFYRADKAHGRSENRFGLGLSIVKSIMNNHHCAFGVNNVADGVEFYFHVAKGPEYYEESSDH